MKKISLVFCLLLLVACNKHGVGPVDPPVVTKYSIGTSCGPNGTITPTLSVAKNENATVTATADDGSVIDVVTKDGLVVPTTANIKSFSFTFSSVAENHTVNVTFKKIIEYTIEVALGQNGSASSTGTFKTPEGSKPTVTFMPAIGYELDVVKLDGVEITITALAYTFPSVTANHKLEVTFRMIPKTILVQKSWVLFSFKARDLGQTVWGPTLHAPELTVVKYLFYSNNAFEIYDASGKLIGNNNYILTKDSLLMGWRYKVITLKQDTLTVRYNAVSWDKPPGPTWEIEETFVGK